MNNQFKKAAMALGLAFGLAAAPSAADYAHAARNTEPYSCKINGRIFAPETASIVVDARTGEILSGDRIDARRYPASMTKMMTAALIFDALRDGRLKPGGEITVSLSGDVGATRGYSRSTWLRAGEKLSVEEAILAITVASANNVAVLMAEKLAGSEAAFVALMNKKAADIGMNNTNFENSTGLPDRQQVSTARDMAKLALYLYREYPEYYHYFSAPRAEFGPWRGRLAKYNHNELAVKNTGIDGLKTGFICDAGYNLAASAIDGQDRVISVVFGGRTPHQRNALTERLLHNGLSLLDARSGKPVLAGTQGVRGYLHDDEKPQVANFGAAPGSLPSPAFRLQ